MAINAFCGVRGRADGETELVDRKARGIDASEGVVMSFGAVSVRFEGRVALLAGRQRQEWL